MNSKNLRKKLVKLLLFIINVHTRCTETVFVYYTIVITIITKASNNNVIYLIYIINII